MCSIHCKLKKKMSNFKLLNTQWVMFNPPEFEYWVSLWPTWEFTLETNHCSFRHTYMQN